MTWSFCYARLWLCLLSASLVGALLTVHPLQAASFAWAPIVVAGWSSPQTSNKPPSGKPGNQLGNTRTPAAMAMLPAARAGWTYPQRETLTYEVDWRVFPAGTTVLHMESSGDSQRLTVTGDSAGAINLLFRVNDRFQSTFSRQTGCSSGFARQQIEGSRQITSDQQFSAGQSRASYDEKTLLTHSHHAEQVAIPACVSDPLSAIFYTASQPLQVGQQFHLPVVYTTNVLDVTAHVEGREAVHTPSTTYQTIRVQPTWPTTAVRNSGNIWVWYSDDERHIPVQVRARLFWGTITFRLTNLEQK